MKNLTKKEINVISGGNGDEAIVRQVNNAIFNNLLTTIAINTAIVSLYSGYKLYQSNGCTDAKKDTSVKDYIIRSLADGFIYGAILPLVPYVLKWYIRNDHIARYRD